MKISNKKNKLSKKVPIWYLRDCIGIRDSLGASSIKSRKFSSRLITKF